MRAVARASFALLLIGAFFSGSEPGAAVESVPPALQLDGAAWSVDVFGAVTRGTLVERWTNAADDTRDATFWCVAPPAASRCAVRAETTGGEPAPTIHGDRVPDSSPDPSGPRSGRTGKVVRRGGVAAASVSVPPGASVVVRSEFDAPLSYAGGEFVLRLPASARGTAPWAPVAAVSVEVYHDDSIVVRASSPTTDLYSDFTGGSTVVTPAEGLVPADRDLVVRLLVGAEREPTLLGYSIADAEDPDVREVVAVLAPPLVPGGGSVRAKEIVFVIDTSGSMAKDGKIEQARRAVVACLDKLAPSDRFNIFEFDESFSAFRQEPADASEASRLDASRWLQARVANGKTLLAPALTAVFAAPAPRDLHPMVVIVTDGVMHDEAAAMERLRTGLAERRLFVLGIGEDVSGDTIRAMAAIGRGTAAFATDAASLAGSLGSLFDSVADPVAWDLAVDWGAAELESVEPARLPDLYAGRPVTLRARVRGGVPASFTVRGVTTRGERTFTAPIRAVEAE